MSTEPDEPRKKPSKRFNAPGRPNWTRESRRLNRPRREAGRGRFLLGALLIGLFVLLVSLRGIAAFYTDKLWFESLGLGSVWSTTLGTKISLTLLGTGLCFGLIWANMVVAERIAPAFRPLAPADDLIERYHDMVGRRAATVRLVLAFFLALLFGTSLGANWNEWLLFRNRVDFGQTDATFNVDIGFYVFQLPFITAALSWLFSVMIVVLFTTLLVHIVNGGVRFHNQMERTTPQVKAHVSVLLGALALVQAARYWVGRYQINFSSRGTVDGATYTDVNVELRAVYLLVVIALFAFGLFIANIWRRGWVLPVMAVGLWIFVAALAGGIVPAFVQRFRVEPSESSMEAPYIARNIAATRAAYGLELESETFDWKGDLTTADLAAEVETLENVRLWDPAIMKSSFDRQQQLKGFYEFNDVDVDRYEIDGKVTPVMIAARDLNTAGVAQASWEATHLAFTHGYGVVAAKANDRTRSGDPALVARDIPVVTSGGLPEIDVPGIYFGENKSGYAIVDTERPEIDYQNEDNEPVNTTYEGADGVRLGSGLAGFVRRSAFALRFGDINPLVSGNIKPDSRVLMERDVSQRLTSVAPFLSFDADPYVVVEGGRVQYIVDAYTTSANYPNAQRAATSGLSDESTLQGESFNYIRNSVKAVVDAYDGTVTLYVMENEDSPDPIIRAYRKAFPDLFTDGDQMPDGLRDHLRYPEDLFTVQTEMWARYHESNADTFYNGNSEWSVPGEPGGKTVSGETTRSVDADGKPIKAGSRYASKYMMLKLPGDDHVSFVLLRPYVPASRGSGNQNLLTSFMVASSDPGSYGKLRSFTLRGSLPDGPITATDNIQSDAEVASLRRNICQGQAVCNLATPSIVPIGNSILYVQSFFVAGTDLGAPNLERVIVSYQSSAGTQIEVDNTFRGALVKIFGEDVPGAIEDTDVVDPIGPDTPGDPTDPVGPTDPVEPDPPIDETMAEQQARLINELDDAFAAADAAARSGDMVTYAREIDSARAIAEELKELQAGEAGGGTEPSAPPDGGGGVAGNGSSTTTTSVTTTTTGA